MFDVSEVPVNPLVEVLGEAELAERVAAASKARVQLAVDKALALGDRGVSVWVVNGVAVRALPDLQVPFGQVHEYSVPPWRQVP